MIVEDCYYWLHKKDLLSGFCYNISSDDSALLTTEHECGIFVSTSFDSAQKATVWHRARVFSEGSFVKLSFYCADSKDIEHEGKIIDLDEFISSSDGSEQSAEYLSRAVAWQEQYVNAEDIWLHNYCGRYIWIRCELINAGGLPKVKKIKLYYPGESFIRYLPEIYQQGDTSFLKGFIGMFQSLYLDMDEAIADIPKDLDPSSTKKLDLLAEWMCLVEFNKLSHPKLREFLVNCADMYRHWGTKACMIRALEIVCAEEVYVVEHFELKNFSNTEMLEKIYGDQNFSFAVILKRKYDNTTMQLIERLIKGMKPAHTSFKLIILKNRVQLDAYTYLGINSVIGGYNKPELDKDVLMENLILER